jgi:hypothetical protein
VIAFLWTAGSGWLAVLLLAMTVATPFVRRGLSGRWLRVHYGLGCAVPALAAVHAWLPMSARLPIHQASLLIATAALFAMLVQAVVGAGLRPLKGLERRRTRRLHLWGMTAVAVLAATHVGLERFA